MSTAGIDWDTVCADSVRPEKYIPLLEGDQVLKFHGLTFSVVEA